VRSYVAAGDYRRAGRAQLEAGNLREAYNLFERGGLHAEATHVAAKLGWHIKAARHAEAAGELERAAALYEQAGSTGDASRLYRRVGRFQQAVALLERDADADPTAIAELWESIYLDRLPKRRQTLDQAGLTALRDAAEAAADAYKRAGQFERAMHFIEASRAAEAGESLPVATGEHRRPEGATAHPSRRRTDAVMGAEAAAAAVAGELEPVLADPTKARAAAEAAIRAATASAPLDPSEEPLVEELNSFAKGSMTSPIAMPPPAESPVVHVPSGPAKLARVETVAQVEVLHIRERDTAQGCGQTDPDRYEVHEELGRGGMAVVYRAHDRILERDVALKFLPEGVTTSEAARRMFVREAKAVAKLNHANIITIHDFGTIGPRPFICMELVIGRPLNRVIDEAHAGRLEIDQALLIADGLLAALELAHGRDVLHRDIKPSNVMVTDDWTAKLMDFGIAKILDSSAGGTTQIAGTPSYMAPEQMVGRGLDARTDLFAVGVTLYEMVTGYLPYEGMRRDQPPITPRQLRPELPAEVEAVILSCLSLEPEGRPSSARSARKALGELRMAQAALEVRAAFGAARPEVSAEPSSDVLALEVDAPDSRFADPAAAARDEAPHTDEPATAQAADDEAVPLADSASHGDSEADDEENLGHVELVDECYTGDHSVLDLREELGFEYERLEVPVPGLLDVILPRDESGAGPGIQRLAEEDSAAGSTIDFGDFDEAATAAVDADEPEPEPEPAPPYLERAPDLPTSAAPAERAESGPARAALRRAAAGRRRPTAETVPVPSAARSQTEEGPAALCCPSASEPERSPRVGEQVATSGRPASTSGAVEAVADHMVARAESGKWDAVVSAALSGLTLREVRQSLEAEAAAGRDLDAELFAAAIADPRSAVRRSAIELYPRFDAELVRLLIKGLRDAERCVREAALRRISTSRERRFGPVLAKFAAATELLEADPDEREALFSALVSCGGDAHLDVLERALALLGAAPLATDRRGARAEERYARDIVTAVASRQSEAGVALATQVRDLMRERNARRALLARASQIPSATGPIAPSAKWGDTTPAPEECGPRRTGATAESAADGEAPSAALPDPVEALLRDYLDE
jgi:tetratricopeptide (TPR) repeat protein